MKANELRIGNLIIDEHGTLSNIVEITDYDRIAVGNNRVVTDLSNCEPIPLTEEWAEKFGVQYTDTITYKGYIIRFDNIVITIKNDMVYLMGQQISNVKYVHQFQNLYFILTGKELTIK